MACDEFYKNISEKSSAKLRRSAPRPCCSKEAERGGRRAERLEQSAGRKIFSNQLDSLPELLCWGLFAGYYARFSSSSKLISV